MTGLVALAVAGCTTGEPEARPGGAEAVRLWFGGDVHLGAPRVLLDPGLRAELHGVGVINLEGPIGPPQTTIAADGTVTLVHDIAVLGSLRDAGVGVVGIQNNHAGDAGPVDLTAAAVRDAGLQPTPARVGELDLVQIDLALESAGAGAGPGSVVARGRPAGGLPDGLADLGGAKIVALHVSGPPDPLPSEALRSAVDAAIEAGARVVVAHGTHAIGPVERRGDSVIAWGLGNLAFDCPCTRISDGLVLEVTLGGRWSERGRGVEARVVPIRAGLDGAPAALAPDPGAVLDVLAALSPTPLRREVHGAWF